MTHYEVLGIGMDASAQEIRRAFVAQARRHHPDYHANAAVGARHRAELEMQRVNAAWAVLGDPAARRAYDLSLRRPGSRASSTAPSPSAVRSEGLRKAASGASAHFRPIDRYDGVDDEGLDPALLDDTPYPGASPPPRWMQLAPIVLFCAGLGLTILGLVVGLRELVGVGFVTLALAGVAFLLAPFYVMARRSGR